MVQNAKALGAQFLAQRQLELADDGGRNWPSCESTLERLCPKEWGLLQRKELSGPEGTPLTSQATTWVMPVAGAGLERKA